MRSTLGHSLVLSGLCVVWLTGTAAGQAQHHALTIRRVDNQLRLVGPNGVQTVAGHAEGVVLDVACDGVDCKEVTARFSAQNQNALLDTEGQKTSVHASFKWPHSLGGVITFRVGQNTVSPPLTLNEATRRTPDEDGDDLESVRRREVVCAEAAELGGGYDRRGNQAEMVVATDGFVISRPPRPMDENDELVVNVMGDPDVLQDVRVVRTSTTRAVGQSRRLGSDAVTGIRRQGAQGQTSTCGWARAVLGDFEPGEGKFRITVGTGTQASNADVTVRVNPLYHGAFSFGPVVSWLRDRSYTVLGDTTVAEVNRGSSDGHYVLSYTHFLLGPRDLEKSRGVYLNPMVGITVNKPLESVFGGVSVDFGGGDVFITGGAHGREVTRLNTRGGIEVGQKLPAGITTVPTHKVWRWAPYVGIQIDVRAAVDLFGKVLTGAGGAS
jgi:hypothetical protein